VLRKQGKDNLTAWYAKTENSRLYTARVLYAYLLHQLDTIIPLERLHRDTSGVSELRQVNRLLGVNSAQINQVLQPLKAERLILASEAGERKTKKKPKQTQTKQ